MKHVPSSDSVVEVALRNDPLGIEPDWAHVSGWMEGVGEAWTISCIVPSQNASAALSRLLPRVSDALIDAGQPWEVLIVDAGSDDGTEGLMRGWAQLPGIRWLRASRWLAHRPLLLSGLEKARGDVILALDPRLQSSLHLLPQMLSLWRRGARLISIDDAAARKFRTWSSSDLANSEHAAAAFSMLSDSDDLVAIDRASMDAMRSQQTN